MRRMLGSAFLVTVLVALGACTGDDDDDTSTDTTEETEAPSDDEAESADEAAYVEAIAESSEDDFSPEVNQCAANVYVDVIGLDILQGMTTPDEIRENPEDDVVDFGIELDEQQRIALVDGLNECIDIGLVFAAEFEAEGVSADTATTGACLAQGLESDELKVALGTTFVDSEAELTAPQADVFYQWMSACSDLRGVLVSGFAEGAEGAPPELIACVAGAFTDDLVKRFWVASFSNGDTSAAEAELTAATETCAASLGLAP